MKELLKADQVRKILDRAYPDENSKEIYPTDEEILNLVEKKCNWRVGDYMGNGHNIVWFSDWFSNISIMMDLENDKFIDHKWDSLEDTYEIYGYEEETQFNKSFERLEAMLIDINSKIDKLNKVLEELADR